MTVACCQLLQCSMTPEVQAVASVVDVAVGANISDELLLEGLSFFAVIQLAMNQPLLSSEAILELVAPAPHIGELRPEPGLTATKRQYVLGVIRGVAACLAHLSRDIHRVLSGSADDRIGSEAVLLGLYARTGKYQDRSM